MGALSEQAYRSVHFHSAYRVSLVPVFFWYHLFPIETDVYMQSRFGEYHLANEYLELLQSQTAY